MKACSEEFQPYGITFLTSLKEEGLVKYCYQRERDRDRDRGECLIYRLVRKASSIKNDLESLFFSRSSSLDKCALFFPDDIIFEQFIAWHKVRPIQEISNLRPAWHYSWDCIFFGLSYIYR